MTLNLGSILILILAAIPACAQHMNEKDSPCANVVITAELGDCLFNAKDKADAELNVVYKQVRSQLHSEDAERLTKTQRLWIQYRDANCSAERDLYDGGTAKYPAYYACLESMSRARMRELQVTYAIALK